MSALKLLTLKQKLWAIIAASFLARVIVFFALPNTPTTLAPDEATYASLANWIEESRPASKFPTFGEGLYLSGRTLILPASLLIRAGMNELDAVRLISTFYGFFGLVLIVFLTLKLTSYETYDQKNKKYNENLIIGLVFIFAFLPSHFMWTNLALRESATTFGLLVTFVLFFLITHHHAKSFFLAKMTLIGSIILTFSARPQVGWVLVVSLILYLLLNFRKTKSTGLIIIVLCGLFLGSALNSGASGITLQGITNPLINAGEVVAFKQEANQVDAASVITPPACPGESDEGTSKSRTRIDTYLCIAWRAPYMVSTFLFRPILGIDVTSTSSLIAAIENIFWLGLFTLIIVLVIRGRTISFLRSILPAMIFFGLYVLGASGYQGNMGTAFRHKSLILWGILLLIFALAWRKPEGASTRSRNNSQESAV